MIEPSPTLERSPRPDSIQASPAPRRCLFVGLGGIGQRHLRNVRTLFGDALDVVAYRARGERHTLDDSLRIVPAVDLEQKYGVHVLSDLDAALAAAPDVAFITNPTSMHIEAALRAARAGCHLLIEKPLSHSLSDVGALLEVSRQQRLVTLVAYQLRWHPGFLRVRELLARECIGRVLSVRAEVGEYLPDFHPYEDYRRMYASRKALGGGVTLSQIHEIDLLYALFGYPRRVFSMGGHCSSLEIDVDDVALSLLEFTRSDGGPLWVELHQDFVQRSPQRSLSVLGERGRIEWSLSAKSLRVWNAAGELVEAHEYTALARNQLYLDELRHFFECVRERRQTDVSLAEGARSLEVALALLESQATGRPIEPAQGERAC